MYIYVYVFMYIFIHVYVYKVYIYVYVYIVLHMSGGHNYLLPTMTLAKVSGSLWVVKV